MSDPIKPLTERLAELGRLLLQTNEQVVAYLADRETKEPADNTGPRDAGPHDAGILPEKIDALIEKVERLDALSDAMRQLEARVDAKLQELAEQLRPPQPQPSEQPAAGPASDSDWQRAVLGTGLAELPGLDLPRRQLMDDVLEGDPGACAFVGQLLVFRSAMTDKMPPLLKDVGEAYYRWRPKSQPGSDPMEDALVEWLGQTIQDAGIANTIEPVHPGERFDSTRHTAATRGVEITEVRGWIVLRDNGRVYTKANVAVR